MLMIFEKIIKSIWIIQNEVFRFWRTSCNEELRNFYPLQYIIKFVKKIHATPFCLQN